MTTAADSALLELLAVDDVLPRVFAFSRRFGPPHSRLLMHAALPLGLTPELVHLLRVNFIPSAPFIAEADVLLSSMCREVGGGLYEMDPSVRELLVSELEQTYGRDGVLDVAEFLILYATQALRDARDPDLRAFFRTQQWAALAYGHPELAAEELARALGDRVQAGDHAEAQRIARVTATLMIPLAAHPELIHYSAGVESLLEGDEDAAGSFFSLLREPEDDVAVGLISLPPPNAAVRSMGDAKPSRRPRDDGSEKPPRSDETPSSEPPAGNASEEPRTDRPPSRNVWAEYTAALAAELRVIHPIGWGSRAPRGASLLETFIPPRLQWIRTEEPERETIGIRDLLRNQGPVLVFGDPGGGKSTLLRYVALTLAAAWSADDGVGAASDLGLHDRQLPFLARLHRPQMGPASSHDMVALLLGQVERLCGTAPASEMYEMLHGGRCTVLVDGLGELAESVLRHAAIATLEAFAAEFPACRLLVTSRVADLPVSEARSAGFALARIAPWNDQQAEEALYRWLAGTGVSQKLVTQLLQTAHSSPSLADMMRSPLGTAMLASVLESTEGVPGDVVELFQAFIDRAVESWESVGSSQGLPDADFVKQWLAAVARRLEPDRQTWFSVSDAVLAARQLGITVPDLHVRELLDAVVANTSLIVEAGPDQYRFVHRVLQEFLAGRAEGKPPAEQVEAWAREHGLPNPYDMGTRNWEQCLYDLGYVGGVDHGIEPHPPGDAGPGYRGRPRVLVTGTGKRDGLTDAELWASEAVGRAFARAGYGLIVGGWPGVDYVVAEEYEESLGAGATAAGEMLTQVIASGQTPDYPGGTIVHAESDSDSYDEAIRRADAVVLIGGLGGTRETFERARKSGVPIFPLAGTGGDAADAFERLRVDRRAHDLKGLERPIKSPRDADVLAETLIERLANAGRTRA